MPDDEGEAPGRQGDEPERPITLSLIAGGVVAAVAVVVGVALLVSSDVGGLVGGSGRPALDVALVGDSFADQSRVAFLDLAEQRDLEAEAYAQGGSSICAWDDQLHRLAEREPDMLVLSFAGNDLQACINPTGQPREPATIAAAYQADLVAVIELFRPTGTDLYVVDPPPIRDPQFEANAAAMRDAYRRASAEHPRITVIETDDRLGPDGAFHAALPCEQGDQDCRSDDTVVLRQGDGIHLTPAGGRRYALAIFDELDRGT